MILPAVLARKIVAEKHFLRRALQEDGWSLT
jgi:hypothetical protein